jgi:quinoprotein glucose dehydrogenase
MHFSILLATSLLAAHAPRSVQAQDALKARAFAPLGMTGSTVGICADEQGRIFITQTNRRTVGALDIRKYGDWVLDTLSFRSVADRADFIRKNFKKGVVGDRNKDGKTDWHDLEDPSTSEQIFLLEDTDGDGTADKKTLYADGFHTVETELAGGVLALDGDVYATIIPTTWKMRDTDGDGKADVREELATGFGIHIAYGGHDMHGLRLGPDGKIYWSVGDKALNVTSKEGRNFAYHYHGAVVRCNPNGSDFEVFASGLRNPQELAFDDFGNLFVVDNDGDFGDKERFHYVVEGSDSGWRAVYQYRSNAQWKEVAGYNAWTAEKLWKPAAENTGAYITPCLSNYSDGPCGFTRNPGTALGEAWKGYFFLTEFPAKRLRAFRTEPDGAGFKMVDDQVAYSGINATGINFGPDGALYLADWGDNEWLPHEKGRIMVIDTSGTHDPLRDTTRKLLGEGMAGRGESELVALLTNADQRVRLGAQRALVSQPTALRAAALEEKNPLLTRVHALWGFAAAKPDPAPIRPLLGDSAPEIRAQAAQCLGNLLDRASADEVAKLLADSEPRVRLFAGIALGKIGSPPHFDAIVAMLAANQNKDAFLRHAGVMALTRTAPEQLASLKPHPAPAVRLAAVLALRRTHDPAVAAFLTDTDPAIVLEAARAITDDETIPAALPALAELPIHGEEALVRRLLNAQLHVRSPESVEKLAAFAANPSVIPELRAEAIACLAAWEHPSPIDRVTGWYRVLPNGDLAEAQHALDSVIGTLLADAAPEVQKATAAAIKALRYGNATVRLEAITLDPKAEAGKRATALTTLGQLGSAKLKDCLAVAFSNPAPILRAAACSVLAGSDPASADLPAHLAAALQSDNLSEKQNAIAILGELQRPEATELLDTNFPPRDSALALDLVLAVQQHPALAEKLAAYESAKAKDDPLSPWIEALTGGNPTHGREIATTSLTAACIQCHRIDGAGGLVGPDLAGAATRLDPRQILESLVFPQNAIAEGFGLVNVTLKDGSLAAGIIESENADELVLRNLDGTLGRIASTAIASKSVPVSSMPPMGALLPPRELRDVLAFLLTLKETTQP